MEIKIVEERPNPLLKRTEYRFEVGHAGQSTPSRETIRKELAKDLHVPQERVVVEEMGSKFGTPKTVGDALVYASSDDAKAIEREHVLLRNRLIAKESEGAPGAATEGPTPPAESAPPAKKPEPAAPAQPEAKPAEKPPAKSKAAEKSESTPAQKVAEKPPAKPKAAEKSEPASGEKPTKKPSADTAPAEAPVKPKASKPKEA